MVGALSSPAWLLILLMVGLGKLFQTRGTFPPQAHETLNRYVIDVALPGLVLTSVQGLSLRGELVGLVLLAWAVVALGASLVLLLARILAWPRRVTGAMLLCVPLGNTAFLGYPLTEAMIGPEAVPLAVIYDQFGTFIALSTYGLVIAALYGAGERPSPRTVAGRILRFPPFVVLVLALLPIPWPEAAITVADMLAASLVPTACLAVGLQLRLRLARPLWPALAGGLTIKLLLMPVAALALLRVAGGDGLILRVGVLESAMPPMITAGALATAAGLDGELCAGLVGFGILMSFLSLPLLLPA